MWSEDKYAEGGMQQLQMANWPLWLQGGRWEIRKQASSQRRVTAESSK